MSFHAGHKSHHHSSSSTGSITRRTNQRRTCRANSGVAGNDENQVGDNRSLTVMTNKRRENIAYMWWNSHLRPGRSGWLQFKDTICDFGFIPVQYKAACPQREGETNHGYSLRFRKYILEHGTQGVHYALGWVGLYELVVKYGVISIEPPRHEKHAHSILSYNGPPLVEESSPTVKVPWSIPTPITTKPCSSASLPLKKRPPPSLTVIFTTSPPPPPPELLVPGTTKEDHEPSPNQQNTQLPSHQDHPAMLDFSSSDYDDDEEVARDGHALAIATFMEHYDPLPKNPRCVQKWDV